MGLCRLLRKNKWRGKCTFNASFYLQYLLKITGALATDSRRKDLFVINEAFRLQMMPELDEIKDKSENIRTIERAIRV